MSSPPWQLMSRQRIMDSLRRRPAEARRDAEGRPAPHPKRNLTATLREWHKRAGLLAFLFMGWLGISGILLNEASDLGLNSVRIDWTWLMALYGLHAEPPATGLTVNGHWLAVAGESTVLDGKPLPEPIKSPLGLAETGGGGSQAMLYVATSDSIVLLSLAGAKVDELRMPPLPVAAVRQIGFAPDEPGSVAVDGGDAAYVSLDQGENWKPIAADKVHWSALRAIPDAERKKLIRFSRPSVALQQILVDAHSGRLFGRFGTYVIDVMGLAALLLATSGVWMWWRMNRRRQQSAPARTPPSPARSAGRH